MVETDPYAVLNLPRNFTVEQLRHHYKSLARQLHPDKIGSRLTREEAHAMFQLLTESYQTLLREADRAKADKPFDQLRSASRQQPDDLAPMAAMAAMTPAPNSFNVERFNQAFEKERIPDPVRDRGYAKWMMRNDPDQGMSDKDRKGNRQMIVYEEPSPVALTRKACVAFSELGVGRVNDYSRDDATRHGIQYTDYKVAHTTTNLIDEASIKARLDFRNLDDLQKHRASLSYQMSDEDAQRLAQKKREQEEEEQRRAQAQREQDRRFEDHFSRVHRHLLGYAPKSA